MSLKTGWMESSRWPLRRIEENANKLVSKVEKNLSFESGMLREVIKSGKISGSFTWLTHRIRLAKRFCDLA